MTKTLQQIKDQVAQRMGFGNWKRFEQFVKPTSAIVDEVAQLYANAKLDEASEVGYNSAHEGYADTAIKRKIIELKDN